MEQSFLTRMFCNAFTLCRWQSVPSEVVELYLTPVQEFKATHILRTSGNVPKNFEEGATGRQLEADPG